MKAGAKSIGDDVRTLESATEHADGPLHCHLEIAACCSKVVRDDDGDLNVIEGACSLQTEGLRGGEMTEKEDEM